VSSPNRFLIVGAILSALAALIHVGCIIFGGTWYRALGAGERMAQMAEAGHWYPSAMAGAISLVLLGWSAYALSGAGVIRRLPLLRFVLCGVTAVYLVRGLVFVPLMPYFPGNSVMFWLVTSAICLGFGLVHLAGLRQAWARL
jgi:hypothetical protein